MSYQSQIQSISSLVAAWPLNEVGTTATDVEGGFNGTYTNVTGLNRGAAGLLADGSLCCDFLADANNGHVVVADNAALDMVAGYTVAAWFNCDSLANVSTVVVHQATNAGFVFRILTDGKIRLTTQWVSSFKNHDSAAGAITTGTTFYVAVRLNADLTVTILKNGVELNTVAAGAAGPGNPASSVFFFARDASGTEELNGKGQWVEFYNAAVATSDLLANYTAGITAPGGVSTRMALTGVGG